MTITHDTQIDLRREGRTLSQAIFATPSVLIEWIRRWHLALGVKRDAAPLSSQLKRDIGEIDHLPPRVQSFGESKPTSYQDRLEQMWLR
jgi:hypothetical protein